MNTKSGHVQYFSSASVLDSRKSQLCKKLLSIELSRHMESERCCQGDSAAWNGGISAEILRNTVTRVAKAPLQRD